MRKRDGVWLVSMLLLAITLAGAVGWQLLCYPVCDDYLYRLLPPADTQSMERLDEWMPLAEQISSPDEYLQAVAVNFRAYNGRLANFLYMTVAPGPLPVDKAVCGLLVFLMFILLLRTGLPTGMRMGPWYVVLGIILFWIVFPWGDGMESSAYIFNYPGSSVLMLCFVLRYGNFESFGPGGKCGMVLFAFVMGWMHEAFALCLGAYIVGYGLQSRRWGVWQWALLVAGSAGLALILLSAMHVRLNSWAQGRELNIFTLRNELVYVSGVLLTVLGAALCGIWTLRRRKSGADGRSRAELCGFLLAMLVGICVCIVLGQYRRVRWAADVFVVLIFLRTAAVWLPGVLRLVSREVVLAGCVVFAGLYAWWFAGVLTWQKRVRDVCVVAERAVAPRYSTGASVLYAPLIREWGVPWYYLGLPYPVYSSYYFCDFFGAYWTGNRDLAFMPEQFRGLSFQELPQVEGTAGVRGEYPWLYIDREYQGIFAVQGGEADFSKAPGPWFVDKLNGLIHGGSDVVYPVASLTPVCIEGAERIYRVNLDLPYSFGRRDIIRVDTVCAGSK